MSSRFKTLQKKWVREGYEVTYIEKREEYHGFYGTLWVKRTDSKPILFYEEWSSFKELASSQTLYIMPIAENEEGYAKVFVVEKKLILDIPKRLKEAFERFEQEYWVVQGGEDIQKIKDSFLMLHMRVIKIQKSLRQCKTGQQQRVFLHTTFLKDQFDEMAIHYIGLYKRIEKLSPKVKQCLDAELHYNYSKYIIKAS